MSIYIRAHGIAKDIGDGYYSLSYIQIYAFALSTSSRVVMRTTVSLTYAHCLRGTETRSSEVVLPFGGVGAGMDVVSGDTVGGGGGSAT